MIARSWWARFNIVKYYEFEPPSFHAKILKLTQHFFLQRKLNITMKSAYKKRNLLLKNYISFDNLFSTTIKRFAVKPFDRLNRTHQNRRYLIAPTFSKTENL
jgi:hypothetical protein